MVCCGLRKEPCAAINAQIIKTRRLERSSKKAGRDQARRLEKTKQEGWKKSSKKAGKD